MLTRSATGMRALEIAAALALAAGVLVYLYMHAHSIESERNSAVIVRLLELKQLDATLNQEILRDRYNLSRDYAGLESTIARQNALVAELQAQDSVVSQLGTPGLRAALDSYVRIQKSRAALAEHYVSTSRSLKRVIDRFPDDAYALEKNLRRLGTDEDTLDLLHILEDDALLYLVQGGGKLRSEMDGWIASLDLNLVGLPAETVPELNSFLSTTRALMVDKAEIDGLIDRLFSLNGGALIDKLHLAYVAAYQRASRHAETYRQLMLIFGGVLICCIAYILARLRRNVLALNAANKHLQLQRLALEESNNELAREIDERRRAQADLIHAKETAEYANRAKSEFLANMSHELRTPLNAIIGFSQIIRDRMMGPELGRYIEYAEAVLQSGEHLLQVINDILDLSKIEAGKADLEERPVDLQRAVDDCIHLVQERVADGGLTLVVQLAPALPELHADERKLKQILINLLSNAVKFTPEGGRVTIGAGLAGDGGLAIVVADTGIGMAEDGIAVALEPFRQLENPLTRKYEGTGLGLPLTRRLVEMHGGRLEIASALGRGTSVSIYFPAERVARAPRLSSSAVAAA